MAKKTRRARKATQQQRIQQKTGTQYENVSAGAVAAVSRAGNGGKAAHAMTTAQAAVNFREEYHYVAADLKRVAILALVMFAVLIALAFILPALGV